MSQGLFISILVPPSPTLLSHNFPVSDVERHASRSTLAQITAAIARIDGELSRLYLAKLRLQQLQHQHELVISPLRRVPDEIIGEIMKHAMPIENDRSNSKPHARTACLLASVCSRWRHTAIHNPQIWTTIHPAIPGTLLLLHSCRFSVPATSP